MYAREIDGAVHTFGVSGKLIMNVLVMYDHQTRSLWSQFLGQAIEGPKRGVKLDLVPVTQTAWALWTDNHPDTLILDKQGGYRGDSYHYYYRDGQKGVLGESNEDNRLAPKELVVGVSLDGDTKAYPLEALRSQPTVNDSVGGNDVAGIPGDQHGNGPRLRSARRRHGPDLQAASGWRRAPPAHG